MSLFGRAYADGDRLEVDGAAVRLRVHRGARRVSLRLDRRTREIVATAPSARRLSEAAAFARSRTGWIATTLSKLPDPAPLTPGMILFVLGEPVRLVQGTGRARYRPPGDGAPAAIEAMGEGEGFARAATLVIRRRALAALTERTAHYAGWLGQPMPKVSLQDATGRWGSCRPGAVRYSWRLALAPLAVLDYVAAHECAHLVEANHGPRFWALVRDLCGDPAPHRAWLRAEGARLHAVGS